MSKEKCFRVVAHYSVRLGGGGEVVSHYSVSLARESVRGKGGDRCLKYS